MNIKYYFFETTGWTAEEKVFHSCVINRTDRDTAQRIAKELKAAAQKRGLKHIRVAIYSVREYDYCGTIR